MLFDKYLDLSQKRSRQGHRYNGRLIGTCMCSIARFLCGSRASCVRSKSTVYVTRSVDVNSVCEASRGFSATAQLLALTKSPTARDSRIRSRIDVFVFPRRKHGTCDVCR